MEIQQNRHSNRIRYAFGEDEVQYSLQDSSGSRSFSVAYTDISRDRSTLVVRNQWLRNVGLLWLALGAVLTVTSSFGKQQFVPSMWLFLGAACYAVYHFRSTRFTILPSDKGNLLVIDDADGQKIISELESRRAAQFRSEYGSGHFSRSWGDAREAGPLLLRILQGLGAGGLGVRDRGRRLSGLGSGGGRPVL